MVSLLVRFFRSSYFQTPGRLGKAMHRSPCFGRYAHGHQRGGRVHDEEIRMNPEVAVAGLDAKALTAYEVSRFLVNGRCLCKSRQQRGSVLRNRVAVIERASIFMFAILSIGAAQSGLVATALDRLRCPVCGQKRPSSNIMKELKEIKWPIM